jgi:hypothetical protein
VNSDLAMLLNDKQRRKVVAELVRELRTPIHPYPEIPIDRRPTGNTWLDSVSKRQNPDLIDIDERRARAAEAI